MFRKCLGSVQEVSRECLGSGLRLEEALDQVRHLRVLSLAVPLQHLLGDRPVRLAARLFETHSHSHPPPIAHPPDGSPALSSKFSTYGFLRTRLTSSCSAAGVRRWGSVGVSRARAAEWAGGVGRQELHGRVACDRAPSTTKLHSSCESCCE